MECYVMIVCIMDLFIKALYVTLNGLGSFKCDDEI